MSQAALARMDADTFLEWRQDQPGRWELVDGWPVQAMAGAKQRHDLVVVNLIAVLRDGLRGGLCRPTTDDVAARMQNGNLRQPDVTVECAKIEPEELTSKRPVVFFQVLSPSARSIDFVRKIEEYKLVPSLRHIVLLEPNQPKAWVWSREYDGAWQGDWLEGLEAELLLPGAGTRLSLAEIYEDVPFDPA
jgi:Uma2 family endonuclease